MSMLGDEIDRQISAGRRTIEHTLDDVKEMELPRVPPGLVAAGLVTAIVAVGIVGWMVYRSRRKRTLVQRLQDALPDSVRDLPEGLRAPLRRVRQ